MSRKLAPHLAYAHTCLESWASWTIIHAECSVLGVRAICWSNPRSGMPAGPITPEVLPPPIIRKVDRIYQDAPTNHRKTIEIKYINGEDISNYCVDRMLEYVAGRLST